MGFPAEGIKDLLVEAGVGRFGVEDDWSISVGRLTDTPDAQIAIYETGGKQSNPAWNIDYPSVQVRVRGPKTTGGYNDARSKILQVKNALLGLPSQNLNDDRWTAINAIGDIAALGYDKNDRPSFVMNFALIIEPSDMGYRENPV